jgi:aerobic-type carbon monoxide dehydrogenase small subunit (CoxS/CutS family)
MRVSMWWVTAVSYDRTKTLLACHVLVEFEMHVIESVVVTAAVQTGTENRTVPSIVRRRTSLKTVTEHCNDATVALQSSWKTTGAVMTFVDDDDDGS